MSAYEILSIVLAIIAIIITLFGIVIGILIEWIKTKK